jgi:hypothetical protein
VKSHGKARCGSVWAGWRGGAKKNSTYSFIHPMHKCTHPISFQKSRITFPYYHSSTADNLTLSPRFHTSYRQHSHIRCLHSGVSPSASLVQTSPSSGSTERALIPSIHQASQNSMIRHDHPDNFLSPLSNGLHSGYSLCPQCSLEDVLGILLRFY